MGLPVPALGSTVRMSAAYYTVTTVDARGRLAAASAVRALDWEAQRRIRLVAILGGVMP